MDSSVVDCIHPGYARGDYSGCFNLGSSTISSCAYLKSNHGSGPYTALRRGYDPRFEVDSTKSSFISSCESPINALTNSMLLPTLFLKAIRKLLTPFIP